MNAAARGAAGRTSRDAGLGAHRIVFVTGKGGVGKSLVAAATAVQAARAGSRTLLVELGSRSFYGPLLGLDVGTAPVRWRPNLSVVRWDVESSLREYLTHYLVFQANADRLLGNLALKALVAAAPGLSELTLLGKLTAPLRLRWYRRDVDLVVVDAYSTGQFMAFLRAPRGLADSAASGLMHRQTEAIVELLSDPAVCEYRLVTLAEEMPVSEACEMAADLRAETTIAPTLYCNRLLALPRTLPAASHGDVAAPFIAHLRQIAQRQARALSKLDALGDDKAGAVRRLPLVPTDDAAALVDALADALSAAAA
jgi:hypothetical protein